MKKFFLFLVLAFFLNSCVSVNQHIPKENYKENKKHNIIKHVYCVKSININKPMETALDTFTRHLNRAILSSGNSLECSNKTDRYISLNINSLYIYSIGYSISQRASIYKVNVNMDVIIENRKNEPIFKKNISELTQYVGAGLRADIERRYALEELAKLVEIRLYNILIKAK